MVYNVLMLMSRVCCLLPHRAEAGQMAGNSVFYSDKEAAQAGYQAYDA